MDDWHDSKRFCYMFKPKDNGGRSRPSASCIKEFGAWSRKKNVGGRRQSSINLPLQKYSKGNTLILLLLQYEPFMLKTLHNTVHFLSVMNWYSPQAQWYWPNLIPEQKSAAEYNLRCYMYLWKREMFRNAIASAPETMLLS